MKIEDLILLLNNRLREFKLSRDYAKMNGDLERMNTADKEIIGLEDTLYKLNLLIDSSKSAAVKEATLAEVITDGSIAVLGEYDISPYATDPEHEEKVMNILSRMGVMDTAEKINDYVKDKYWSSPVTGEMIMSAALAYIVDARLMMAIMELDSRFGTAGIAVGTLNPGNVGNDDSGNTRTYDSWQEGVTAVAEWLSRHRISEEFPKENVTLPMSTSISSGQATSTPSNIIIPTATSTPTITTSTTTTITNLPTIATSTPAITSTTTPVTDTSTPEIITSTSTTSTSTPVETSNTLETTNWVEETATSTSTPVETSNTLETTNWVEETATSTSLQPIISN